MKNMWRLTQPLVEFIDYWGWCTFHFYEWWRSVVSSLSPCDITDYNRSNLTKGWSQSRTINQARPIISVLGPEVP